jgi:hypothetical protein
MQNIAEANAALIVMESQGLADTTQYADLQKKVKAAIDDLPLAQQALVWAGAASGKNYAQTVLDATGTTGATATTGGTTGTKTTGAGGSTATKTTGGGTTGGGTKTTGGGGTSAGPFSISGGGTSSTGGGTVPKSTATYNASKDSGLGGTSATKTTTPSSTTTYNASKDSGLGGTSATKTTSTSTTNQGAGVVKGKAKGGLVAKPTKAPRKTKGLAGK